MKKLSILLTLVIVVTVSNPVYAKQLEPTEELILDDEYDDEVMYNDGNYLEEAIDSIPAVSQFEDEITNHKNSKGKRWNDRACVATSISTMILRRACLDGYVYNGDPYSKDAVIDVLTNISNQGTMFRQVDCDLYWQGTCYVDILTRDGEPFFAEVETHPSSEDTLIGLLDEHPEGILAFGTNNDHYHGVLVSEYLGDGLYEVYDSATGSVETRDYKHLNNSTNSHYKFASIKTNY